MQHAKIFSSPEKCMKGAAQQRVRPAAGLTRVELGDKMRRWGWNAKKVWRLQNKPLIYLDPSEMADLLTALGAVSL